MLIELFETSGLTVSRWCEESGIPLSTLSSWLRRRNQKEKNEEIRSISLSPVFLSLVSI